MAALAKRLLHVCITVPDLDEALTFYRDVLGFTSVFATRTDEADGGLLGFDQDEIGLYAHHLVLPGGGREHRTEINLVEFTNPRTVVAHGPYSEMNHVGITRLALAVDSVDDAFEKVQAHPGVRIVCAPKDIVIRELQITLTARWFSFTDPYGVFITMTEPPRA